MDPRVVRFYHNMYEAEKYKEENKNHQPQDPVENQGWFSLLGDLLIYAHKLSKLGPCSLQHFYPVSSWGLLYLNCNCRCWGCSSVIDHFHNMHKTLDSVPSTEKKKNN